MASTSPAKPLPRKTFIVPSGHTYSYLSQPPSSPTKPTLLFIHGFPSTSEDWHHQTAHFSAQGYGILAPDNLGHGRSSHATAVDPYVGVALAADMIALLDHEQAALGSVGARVVAVAHDWGVYLMSKLAIYHVDRFEKFVCLSVAFLPPGQSFDVSELNTETERLLGYPIFGYWLFLMTSRAGKVIADNWESFFSIIYTSNADQWKTNMAPIGALEDFITSGALAPLGPWITPSFKEESRAAFNGDYTGAVLWYRRGVQNLGADEEVKLLKEGKLKPKLGKKILLITGTRDVICLAGPARESLGKAVEEGLGRVVELDAGHWIMMEKAEETNKAIEEFLAE